MGLNKDGLPIGIQVCIIIVQLKLSHSSLKKKFLGSKVWQVRGADNLTTIYEPIV
jgi:hypothetical protein